MNRSGNAITLLTICVALALAACRESAAPAASTPQSLTIMTFNVENLFDNIDDPVKDDRTYLALTNKQNDDHRAACAKIEVRSWRDDCFELDWNDDVINRKLRAVAETILQVGNGRGADIIAFQEVENIGILERLRNEYLAAADYQPAVLIEGNDLRGIDVAFLSRLPLAGEPVLHPIAFADIPEERVRDTRGILQADFSLPDGSVLTGFAVHFPAPFHPTVMRETAYTQLNGLLAALPADRPAFAAGDFNTSSKEDSSKDLLGRFVRPQWNVAHELGCDGCPGTQYYAPEDSWSFLDMILWSPFRERGADATWSIRADSVQLANKTAAQASDKGTPARFEAAEGSGVSDHWPLAATIELKQKQ